jgi:hypothetical protein
MKQSPQKSAREAAVTKIVAISSGVIALLLSAIWTIVVAAASGWIRLIAGLGASAVALLVMYLGREGVARFILRFASAANENERALMGNWTIAIEYMEASTRVRRCGRVEASLSVTGLHLRGGKLLDDATNEIVAEFWDSDFCELAAETTGTEYLIYGYKVSRSRLHTGFDKVGYGVLTRSGGEGSFSGPFHDIAIAAGAVGGERIRSGTVTLFAD